jgi:hypothetical protein
MAGNSATLVCCSWRAATTLGSVCRWAEEGWSGSGLWAEDIIGFVLFFLNLFPVRRIILEKSINYFKAQKVFKKFKKSMENSQR